MRRSVSARAPLRAGLGGGAAALPRTVPQSTCFAVTVMATADFDDENGVLASGAGLSCWNWSESASTA